MYYLGIDVGTSSLKVTMINEKRQILYEAGYPYCFDEPQEGYREIQPEIWLKTTLKALKDLLKKYDVNQLTTIGITGQMHTAVFLDADGASVRPAIMWNDLRTRELVPQLKATLAKNEETKYIAKIISPGSPATDLLWLYENERDHFMQIKRVMSAYDYLVYGLTGCYSLDYCDASTSSLYDIATKQWSEIMLNLTKIKGEALGEVYPSCKIVGSIKSEIAEMLGINHEVNVIAGTGDNPANAVSMGILQSKHPMISLGTSGVVIVAKDDGEFDGVGKNVIFTTFGEKFINVVQGSVRSAGGAHRWWVENIVQSEDMTIDQQDINPAELGNNQVLFFPHITGDKLIYADTSIRGAFVGLSAASARKDMSQALMEGVGFAFKEVLENMNLKKDLTRIKINGGGSRSKIWMQILADILDTEIEVMTNKTSPGYGACLLAYMANHHEYTGDIEQESGIIYRPDDEAVKRYQPNYLRYKKLYKALKEID